MRIRRSGALAVAGLVWLGGLLAGAAPGAFGAEKTASFDVTAVNVTPAGQVTITSRVWITPTRARADVKHPLQGNARLLVAGGSLYQLDPQKKRGVKGPLPDALKKAGDNFDRLFALFAFDAMDALKTAKKVRTERVAGHLCDVYENGIEKGGASRRLTIWMPQSLFPKFPLKVVRKDRLVKPGATLETAVTITLSNVQVGRPIPASIFAVPRGYTIKTLKTAPLPAGANRRGR